MKKSKIPIGEHDVEETLFNCYREDLTPEQTVKELGRFGVKKWTADDVAGYFDGLTQLGKKYGFLK